MKQCSKCDTIKEEHEFYKDSSKKDGLRPMCKECSDIGKKISLQKNPVDRIKSNERQRKYRDVHREELKEKNKEYSSLNREEINAKKREWRHAHPEQHATAQKKYGLKRKYGLTQEQLENLRTNQGNKCKICNKDFDDTIKGRKMVVDHIHGTKIVRGLLCTNCNKMIGCFKENVTILRNAKEYLIRHA